jgi:hypothetical protein
VVYIGMSPVEVVVEVKVVDVARDWGIPVVGFDWMDVVEDESTELVIDPMNNMQK